MAILNLKNCKIEFSDNNIKDFTEEQLKEWFLRELSLPSNVSKDNPLFKVKMKDCKLTIGSASVDGVPVEL